MFVLAGETTLRDRRIGEHAHDVILAERSQVAHIDRAARTHRAGPQISVTDGNAL